MRIKQLSFSLTPSYILGKNHSNSKPKMFTHSIHLIGGGLNLTNTLNYTHQVRIDSARTSHTHNKNALTEHRKLTLAPLWIKSSATSWYPLAQAEAKGVSS